MCVDVNQMYATSTVTIFHLYFSIESSATVQFVLTAEYSSYMFHSALNNCICFGSPPLLHVFYIYLIKVQ